MNLILKVATSFFVGWFRVAALGAIAVTYAWYWLKFFMTPDEHRREAERLRRERQADPDAHSSVATHEQVATTMEALKFRRTAFWWLLSFVAAMFAIYALAYCPFPRKRGSGATDF